VIFSLHYEFERSIPENNRLRTGNGFSSVAGGGAAKTSAPSPMCVLFVNGIPLDHHRVQAPR
jgi:hypothetical protein